MEELSVPQVAKLLNASQPTVRKLLDDSQLRGRHLERGSRFVWRVERASAEAFLESHGPYPGREPSRLSRLEAEVGRLRVQLEAGHPPSQPPAEVAAERDDLRATVVDLRAALARAHQALELQGQADEARASQMAHLLAAVEAGEQVDALRREALDHLGEALAGFTRPGHVGQLS